jgi:parallel beta-helix repeat protein
MKTCEIRLAFLAVAALVHVSSAATFTVVNTSDSGTGSLRAALLSANAAPGADTILFNIPGSGVQTITPLTPLPEITNALSLDGYSQPGAHPNTLTHGNDALPLIRLDGLRLTNGLPIGLKFNGVSGNTVRGLVVVRFYTGLQFYASSGNVVAGNWIGLDTDQVARGGAGVGVEFTCAAFNRTTGNLLGGFSPADRNLICGFGRGVSFFPASADHNTVRNNFIGTDASGALPRGNVFAGILIQSATNISVVGNLISASTGAGGCAVQIVGGSGDLIQGNMIGSDVSGRYALGHVGNGLSVQGASSVTVNSNCVVNSGGHGIELQGCAYSTVQGNAIGTDPGQTRVMGNRLSGIFLNGSSSNQVGGLTPGAGNLIEFNGDSGVSVLSGRANTISGNSMFDNSSLGIDLGADGTTPNDPGDPDTGANDLQNTPVIASATAIYGAVQINGTLDAVPHTTCRIEFFASAPWDPFWILEGQQFLGATSVTTDAAGHADFVYVAGAADPAAAVVTATATDSVGNTSEFSSSWPVSPGPQQVSLAVCRGDGGVWVSWPSAASQAGFQLETAPSLKPIADWQTVTDGISDDGSTRSYVATNSSAATTCFFRLKKP